MSHDEVVVCGLDEAAPSKAAEKTVAAMATAEAIPPPFQPGKWCASAAVAAAAAVDVGFSVGIKTRPNPTGGTSGHVSTRQLWPPCPPRPSLTVQCRPLDAVAGGSDHRAQPPPHHMRLAQAHTLAHLHAHYHAPHAERMRTHALPCLINTAPTLRAKQTRLMLPASLHTCHPLPPLSLLSSPLLPRNTHPPLPPPHGRRRWTQHTPSHALGRTAGRLQG